MYKIDKSDKLAKVHSDIRGPLFVEALKMQSEGIRIMKLNTGNPATFGFPMPDSVKNAVIENIDRATPYVDVKGLPDAREAICAYHKGKGIRGITPDDIFVGNGVSELVSMCMTALLNDGDEVLVPAPDYSLWSNSIHIAGGTPVYYVCDEENHWYPDVEDIKSKITPRTRAILIINPNNPTGVLYTRELVEQIAQVARENDLILLSDEIYDRLVMDGKVHESTAAIAPDIFTITFNGLSKSHIVCGFRCGWMVFSGPKEDAAGFISGIQALAAMRLCANAIMQLSIVAALNDPESTRAMMVPGGRLYEQREACCRELDKIDGLTYVKNDAAFYIFPKVDAKRFNITSDHQFCMDLLHEKHILMIPGSGFSYPTPDHFRIVMLPEADQMAWAISELGDFLKTYRQK